MTNVTEENRGRALSWDDEIEVEGGDFIVLPPGEYEFTVVDLERKMYEPKPSAKIQDVCPMAVVECEIKAKEGTIKLKKWLILHTITEGLLSAFFGSIGQKEKDQPLRMNWGKVVGSRGWCKVGLRSWKDPDSGEMKQGNEIKQFIRKDNEPVKPQAWTAGSF